MTYYDQQPQISDSVFKLDTGVTAGILRDVDLKIGSLPAGATLFNNPSAFTMTGDLYTTSITPVNPPGLWEGRVFIAQEMTGAYYGTTAKYSLQYPDSTLVGGNPRGNNAVDHQMNRGVASAVASGPLSMVLGGSGNQSSGVEAISGGAVNIAAATATVALGQQNILTGNFSSAPGGKGCTDKGNTGVYCFSSSFIHAQGDNQYQLQTFQGTGTGTIRLTIDGASATGANCGFIPPNTTYGGVRIVFSAIDLTNPGNHYTAVMENGVLGRDTTAGSTAWDGEAFSLPHKIGALTYALPTVSADTGNACFNLSWVTPNGDNWDVSEVMTVDSVQ